MRRLVPGLLVLSLVAVPGCEIIDQVQGVATLMEQAGKHFEEDIKAELTDEKIDLFLRVTPELKEFSENAKVKWEPNPEANDFAQLSTQLGALGDYVAFFESQDTRLTEYWAVMIKVYDAYAVISFDEGQKEARQRLEDERKELETRKSGASGDEAAKIDKELERNQKALENLDEIAEARNKDVDKQQKPYKLTDAEIDRVRARKDEIKAALESSGHLKGEKKAEEKKDE